MSDCYHSFVAFGAMSMTSQDKSIIKRQSSEQQRHYSVIHLFGMTGGLDVYVVVVMVPPPSPSCSMEDVVDALNNTEQELLVAFLCFVGVGELVHEALDLLALLLLRSGCCHRHDGEKAKCKNNELHFAAWSSEGAESLKYMYCNR